MSTLKIFPEFDLEEINHDSAVYGKYYGLKIRSIVRRQSGCLMFEKVLSTYSQFQKPPEKDQVLEFVRNFLVYCYAVQISSVFKEDEWAKSTEITESLRIRNVFKL